MTDNLADSVESWLHDYLTLNGIVVVNERVELNGADTLIAFIVEWPDGFDLHTAAATFADAPLAPPGTTRIVDDLGNEYIRRSGGGAGTSRRAVSIEPYSPALHPGARQLTMIDGISGEPVATFGLGTRVTPLG